LGWCHLRQLAIHPELVGDLWCHHWTSRPPRFPVLLGGGAAAHGDREVAMQQLCLGSMPSES
jgi:hypothetical protein